MNTTEPDLMGPGVVHRAGEREDALFLVERDHEIGAVKHLWARTFDLVWSRPPGTRHA